MSTGKRLAKRSIIGTRVCAPGDDGKYYSGVIQKVKTPPSFLDNNNSINLTPNTRFTVLFDGKNAVGKRNSREYREVELIGPGFRSISGVHLQPGQKVFLTFNGRESCGEVVDHDLDLDEVSVVIGPIGQEGPLELKKRLEEVRLLESRKSARLMDQDTDFARLADMAGDRKRPSGTIEVPVPIPGSRKRRPSSREEEESLDECNAALVLMSLSCSPHSPGVWGSYLGSSPGSSSASWRSGTPSPPLSEDGNGTMHSLGKNVSDEGIAMDFEEMPKKKRASSKLVFQCTWPGCISTAITCEVIESHVRNAHLGPKKLSEDGIDLSDHEEEFYYTEVEISRAGQPSPPSPPTLSHRDMARPPHEDPEYQRQFVGSFRQGLLALQANQPINIPGSLKNSWQASQSLASSPQKHFKLSPKPSTSFAPYPFQSPVSPNIPTDASITATPFLSHSAPSKATAPLSPSRVRNMRPGDHVKCRKFYGMDHRDSWCTQCKWKKACTRFSLQDRMHADRLSNENKVVNKGSH